MKIAIPDIRSATSVGRTFGAVTDEVQQGRSILVVKNNQPVAAIVPPQLIERLDSLDDREEDISLLALAVLRMSTTQAIHNLEDVAAEFGFDLDELRAEAAEVGQ